MAIDFENLRSDQRALQSLIVKITGINDEDLDQNHGQSNTDNQNLLIRDLGIMNKAISISFDPDDLAELNEFIQWKTNKAAGKFASVESNFDLREAADLIRRSKLEKAQILRQIEAQRGEQQELHQQREDVALIPGWEGERMQREWAKEAKQQAESYAAATNSGKRRDPRLALTPP